MAKNLGIQHIETVANAIAIGSSFAKTPNVKLVMATICNACKC